MPAFLYLDLGLLSEVCVNFLLLDCNNNLTLLALYNHRSVKQANFRLSFSYPQMEIAEKRKEEERIESEETLKANKEADMAYFLNEMERLRKRQLAAEECNAEQHKQAVSCVDQYRSFLLADTTDVWTLAYTLSSQLFKNWIMKHLCHIYIKFKKWRCNGKLATYWQLSKSNSVIYLAYVYRHHKRNVM